MVRAAVSELTVPLRNAWNITRYKRAPRAIKSFGMKSFDTSR